MTTHTVKSWTYLFDAFMRGEKSHDIRVMDRDFKVGDELVLQRYDWGRSEYTGEETRAVVTYITSGQHEACAFSGAVLHPKYCILSIAATSDEPPEPPWFDWADYPELRRLDELRWVKWANPA